MATPNLALKLVSVFEAYFGQDEFLELALLFEVELESFTTYPIQWLAVARELVTGLDRGNNRRFVDAVLDLASNRNSERLAHTSFERQEFHRSMVAPIQDAISILQDSAAPSELTVSAGSVFSAKSRVRELLDTATSEVFVVDPYVGIGTLDCLRSLEVSARLLTGTQGASIENGFRRSLSDFVAEGHSIEVRRCGGLHDRHLIFNGRCWLVGGSLKDAGKKPFNCIEIVDKTRLISDLEQAWSGAALFP